MSRKLLRTLVAACVACATCVTLATLYAPLASASDSMPAVHSLRVAPVQGPEDAAENYRLERDVPPIPRDFVQQPPLIPHTVKGYNITKNFNKCMDCHAWSRYKETGATKVSLTHFKDRDGTEYSNISPRRYFCTQCHVPQTDAKPLVSNTFQKAQGLR